MLAFSESSVTVGLSMPRQFAHHEPLRKGFVRTLSNDLCARFSHNRNMTRRGIPKTGPSWFIKEWMDALGVRQRDMVERCDWSKATASQIYNGVQDYSPKIVQEASLALNVEPFELLMHPDRAMALRKLRASAEEIVTIAHNAEDEAHRRDGTNG